MRIDVISLFSEMFEAVSAYGVSGRAMKQGLLELTCYNPRSYTEDRHQTVDDRPFGGGPGMVMKIQPLERALADAKVDSAAKGIYRSRQGRKLDLAPVLELLHVDHLSSSWSVGC